MKKYINNNINFKILGIKNILIFLSIIMVFIFIRLFAKPSLMTVYLYTDVLFPIIFSLIAVYLFKVDCTSNINEVILIYNKKKYNKIFLKRILDYMLLSTLIIFLLTIFLYHNVDMSTLFMKMPKSSFILFLKTITNTIFLTSFLLFLLKITKNIIATGTVFAVFLFQEFAGRGSYTYPFNLFVNYIQLKKFTDSLFIMNRFILVIISALMIYYIVKKKNG